MPADATYLVNHSNLFVDARFETAELPYYNPSTRAFDLPNFITALETIPSQSIVVLQVCGNNPTGCDPTTREWKQLASAFKAHQHFAFFDLSYPGFVSGNVPQDCLPIRLFTEQDIPFLLAVTYGKSFGLYGERVGHLCVPLPTADSAARVEKQMKLLARAETGAQPRFGARIVSTILGDPHLRSIWETELKRMAQDLVNRRRALKRELTSRGAPGDLDFVTNQVGMFL